MNAKLKQLLFGACLILAGVIGGQTPLFTQGVATVLGATTTVQQ